MIETRYRILALVWLVIVPLAMAPGGPKERVMRPVYGAAVVEERDGSDNLVRQVVHGAGGPLWQIRFDGSSQYMHEDPRGNVVMLTEGTGSSTASPGDVLERVTYDAFGRPWFQDAANQNKTDPAGGTFLAQSDFDNDLLFGGMLYDPETGSRGFSLNSDFGGFYATGGRLYNADEGRYLTRSGPSGNRYGLPGHAPVNVVQYGESDFNFVSRAHSGPMPQTREHILLGRQIGVPAASAHASGRRTYEPIRIRKHIDKSATPGNRGGDSSVRGYSEGTYFVADSFSFGVEREMKESGEKGGTADIDIGVGEMAESDPSGQLATAIAIPNLLDTHPDFLWNPRYIPAWSVTCVYPLCGGIVRPPTPPSPTAKDMILKGKKILEN